MNPPQLAPTFRDPAGSLRLQGEFAVRSVHLNAREAVLEFLESPFCRRLQERGDLVAAQVEDLAGEPGGGLTLLHPRIPVPTYPWEWTASQWLAAAELTLKLGSEALDEGWILKDATPLNILFVGPRPVLVDILSFERREPNSTIWLAYGQYVRTFLLPLLMSRLLYWPLALSLFHRDGYEPTELYAALGWGQRMSRAAFWPVTLPALLDKRKAEGSGPGTSKSGARKKAGGAKDPGLTLHVLQGTMKSLRERTRRALPKEVASNWSEYPVSATHYTAAQAAQKMDWVRAALEELRPARVLDVGANTGEFSALAAAAGADVVALERDAAAADNLFRMARERKLPILAVHADLARPTPAAGWENSESSALLPRLEGQFDLVLMLAVIHHLLLLEQIPLAAIVALCHRLTRKYWVVEWVPVSDPMFQSLMRGRDDLYGALAEADLMAACGGRFGLVRRQVLDNGRVLLLFEKAGPERVIQEEG